MKVLRASLLALCTSSCGLEFPQAPESGPNAAVTVAVLDSLRGEMRLHAAFSPGRDANGSLRAVDVDTVLIGEVVLVPSETFPEGSLGYDSTAFWMVGVPAFADTAARLTNGPVVPPRVVGVEPPPRVHLNLVMRAGPFSVRRASNGTLSLPINVPSSPALDTSWELVIASPDDAPTFRRFSLTGTGDPPPTIVVDGSLFGGCQVGGLSAQLRYHWARFIHPASRYRLGVTAVSEVWWAVEPGCE